MFPTWFLVLLTILVILAILSLLGQGVNIC
jgi:hypothetical protein